MAVRTLTTLVETMPRRTASRLIAAMTHAAARLPRETTAKTETAVRGQSHEDGRSLARAASAHTATDPAAAKRTSGLLAYPTISPAIASRCLIAFAQARYLNA